MKRILALIAILIALVVVPVTASAHTSHAQITNDVQGAPVTCPSGQYSGPQQQENMLFCESTTYSYGADLTKDVVYQAAIAAANARTAIIVGTPVYSLPSQDWGGVSITYVEFTSGFHMEYRLNGVVKIYNTLNQQVY